MLASTRKLRLSVGLWLIFALLFINCSNIIYAAHDEIRSLLTNVAVNADGSVNIEQDWLCANANGTEWYVPMYNLQDDSIVADLTVSAQTGTDNEATSELKQFQTVTNWQVDKSFQEKAYKCGINQSDAGSELCFGKSEWGQVKYKVKYKVTNVLRKSQDGVPFIYFRFVNDKMKPAPKEASIAVKYADLGKKADGRIWGFGFKADLQREKQAYTTASFAFSSDNHITLLLQFMNVADTANLQTDSRSFKEIKEQALQDSDYARIDNADVDKSEHVQDYVPHKASYSKHYFASNTGFLSNIIHNEKLHVILFSSLIYALIAKLVNASKKTKKPKNINGVKLSKDYYYRNLPYAKRIDLMQYFGQMVDSILPSSEKGFIAAYILKWIKEGNVEPCKYIAKHLFFSKEREGLKLVKTPDFQSKLEEVTFDTLALAAKDSLLSANELEYYAKKNASTLEHNFDYAMKKSKDTAIDFNLLAYDDAKNKRFSLTKNGIESLQNLNGLKNYLRDFTLLNEREAKEVILWDDYLIAASVFGIAEEVFKEFKNLVPDYVFASGVVQAYDSDFYNTLTYIHFANSFSNSMTKGIERAESSRSSGFGGTSSFGGGNIGFSGGGSGGGSR